MCNPQMLKFLQIYNSVSTSNEIKKVIRCQTHVHNNFHPTDFISFKVQHYMGHKVDKVS